MKLVHAAKDLFEMYLGVMQVNICSAIIIIVARIHMHPALR